ncbi:MAG: flavin reductase family protein [Segetibacter sp.]|nr:flavin reductase family protein [Segetibacter sp.]
MIELPVNIRDSKILSNDDKDLLSKVEVMPVVNPAFEDDTLKNIFQYYSLTPDEMDVEIHRYASKLLIEGKVNEAWQVLLTNNIV